MIPIAALFDEMMLGNCPSSTQIAEKGIRCALTGIAVIGSFGITKKETNLEEQNAPITESEYSDLILTAGGNLSKG